MAEPRRDKTLADFAFELPVRVTGTPDTVFRFQMSVEEEGQMSLDSMMRVTEDGAEGPVAIRSPFAPEDAEAALRTIADKVGLTSIEIGSPIPR